MNPPPVLLRGACHAVVALWIGAALGWWALGGRPDPALQPPRSLARIQPRPEAAARPAAPEPERSAPEPTPAPSTAREPEPEPASEPEPTAAPVRAADRVAGRALLDDDGGFPALSCSYEDFASFRDYARAMVGLGARFVVVRNRQILGGIDVASGRMVEASLGAAYSPRARDYTGEPALAELALAARGRFGRGAVVMMLVPREIDAGLFGAIARALVERGDHHERYREIRGRYRRAPGGGVRLEIDSGVRHDGARVAFDWVFDLGQIARSGARGRLSA